MDNGSLKKTKYVKENFLKLDRDTRGCKCNKRENAYNF